MSVKVSEVSAKGRGRVSAFNMSTGSFTLLYIPRSTLKCHLTGIRATKSPEERSGALPRRSSPSHPLLPARPFSMHVHREERREKGSRSNIIDASLDDDICFSFSH